jgi:hypothetical protein
MAGGARYHIAMVSGTCLSVCLFCAGCALAIVLAPGIPWVQRNQWLFWAFCIGAPVFGVGSIVSSRWFRRLIGIPRDDGMSRTAIHQQTLGAYSPAVAVGSSAGPVTVNFGAPNPQPENPRVIVSWASGGPVVTNCGPRLFGVNFTSPPIGDTLVKWNFISALRSGEVAPLKCSFQSPDGTFPTCGLEIVAPGNEHSSVPIKVVCQDGAGNWWVGAGVLQFDRDTLACNSLGFDEMRPLHVPSEWN